MSADMSTDTSTTTASELPTITTMTNIQTTTFETTSQNESIATTITNKTETSQSKPVSSTSISRTTLQIDSTTSNSNTTVHSSVTLPTPQKQHITHDESQVYDWKCDIAPTKIKIYTGSSLKGFFTTIEDELYEYNAETVFPETGKITENRDRSYIYL